MERVGSKQAMFFLKINHFIMNNKLLKIAGIGLVAVLLIFSVIMALNSKQNSQSNIPSSQALDIPTSKGDVKVKDFTKDPVEQTPDTTAIAETPDYQIAFFPKDSSFAIVLQSVPAQAARDKAEQALLDKLGIGIGEACKLQVSLTVPFGVVQNLAGKNYGLSFCPNGLPF
jgi:hypothetical protein